MFCSTIIPTIARPVLSRAVESVLAQSFTADDFEVVVVNDSGKRLPKAEWQRSDRVRILHTNRRERIIARNSGAAIARGRFLHFLDDDDWMLPGALNSFWELAHTTEAKLLYGNSQLVDRQGKPVIQLHHEMNGNCFIQVMAGEWIPLQSTLIEADLFFSVGGFLPRLYASEDIDLSRRIALQADFAGTKAVVACVGMGVEDSSSDYAGAPRYGRWARELLLNEPGVFPRMHLSANSSAWQGRIVRTYLTSIIWNLQHRNLFTAGSRTAYLLASLVLAGTHLFSPRFWHSVTRGYVSDTFIQGFRAANLPVQSRDSQFNLSKVE